MSAYLSTITPNSHWANDYSGAQTFATVTALKAAAVPPTGSSRLAYVQSRKAWFSWDAASTLTANDLDVVALTASVTGRYVRIFTTHRSHQIQGTWYIDPSLGSDDNDGTASNSALKTVREFALRMAGIITVTSTINVLGDLPTSDPFSVALYSLVDYAANSNSTTVTLNVTGQRTQVRTGTISAVTATNRATNTVGSITDAGATWATSISSNYLGVLTSGSSNTRIFWVTRDAGANVAEINNPINESSGAETTFPSANDTYTEYSLTTGGMSISTNANIKVFNWNHPSTSSVGFLTTQGSVTFSTCAVGNLQSVFSPSIILLGCRDGNSSALQPILPGRIQVAGCSFSKSTFTVRSGVFASFSTSLLNTVGILCGGTTTVSPGFVSLTTTGIYRVSGTALSLNQGSIGRITASTVCGSSNTTGVAVLTGSRLIITAAVTPTITGTTELSIDGVANLLPPLEASAGGTLPATSACNTWATWAAAPFNRYAFCYNTGSSVASA